MLMMKVLILCLSVLYVCSATIWTIPENDLEDALHLELPFTISIKSDVPFTFLQDETEGRYRRYISIEVESIRDLESTIEVGDLAYSLELDDCMEAEDIVNAGYHSVNPTCVVSMLTTGFVSASRSSYGLFGLMVSGLACTSQVRGQDECSGVVLYGLDWCMESEAVEGDWTILTFKPSGTCDISTSSDDSITTGLSSSTSELSSSTSDDPITTGLSSSTSESSSTSDDPITTGLSSSTSELSSSTSDAPGHGSPCVLDSDCVISGLYCYQDVCHWSSVLDTNSPYFNRSSPLDKHREHPTTFPADCRYTANQVVGNGIDMCMRPYELAFTNRRNIGTGPSIALVNNGHYSGGFINEETSEIVVAAYWGSSSTNYGRGYIVAIHLETGNRRVISGEYYPIPLNDSITETRGSGDAFAHVYDVKKGPDGMYYAYCDPGTDAHYIARVDPLTGDRELVWQSGEDNGFPQLYSSIAWFDYSPKHLQSNHYGFGILPNGDFLVCVDSTMGTGDGIIRLSYNGTHVYNASSFTMTSDDPSINRGVGDDIRGPFKGYAIKDSKLYGTTTTGKYFMEVDIETGDRVTLVDTNGVTGLIGERWHVYDDLHEMWWTSGVSSSTVVVGWERERNLLLKFWRAEPDVFPWFPLDRNGPMSINSLNWGGMWMHPTIPNRMLFAQDSMSIVEFEIHTGNSRILSI